MLRPDPRFPRRTWFPDEVRWEAEHKTEHGKTRDAASDTQSQIQADAMTVPALWARVAGLDPATGRPMSDAELAILGDWFAVHILRQGLFPVTLDELIAAVDARNGDADGLRLQHVFIVSETGQIAWRGPDDRLRRSARYVIVRRPNETSPGEMMISTSPPAVSRTSFLQVAAWDPTCRQLNFYERIGIGWFWEGRSEQAHLEPTQGRGPFDSHVNGALVMKELLQPWMHWDSNSQTIPLESFPPNDPIRSERYFALREPAHILETSIIRPSVRRSMRASVDRIFGPPLVANAVGRILRHLVTPTTVNIVTSQTRSDGSTSAVRLPFELFIDRDLLLNTLELPADIQSISVLRSHYAAAVAALDVQLRAGSVFRKDGETPFAWPVACRSLDDQCVAAELLDRGTLSRRLLVALTMLDFCNPLASPTRSAILDTTFDHPADIGAIEATIVDGLRRAADVGGIESAAGQVTAWLALSETDLEALSVRRIEAYWANLAVRAQTPEGVLDFMRLADSNRRSFRKRRIAEFDLTMPFSNVAEDAPAVRLLETGELEAPTIT